MFDVWKYATHLLVGGDNIVKNFVGKENKLELGLWAALWVALIEAILSLSVQRSMTEAVITAITTWCFLVIGASIILEITRIFCRSDRSASLNAVSTLLTHGLGIYSVAIALRLTLSAYIISVLPHVGISTSTSFVSVLKSIVLSLISLLLVFVLIAFSVWAVIIQVKYLSILFGRSMWNVAWAYACSIIVASLSAWAGSVLSAVVIRAIV